MGDDDKKDEKKCDKYDIDDDHGGFANDAEEVKAILGVVYTEIPKLLDSISKTLYNPQNAESLGKSVAQFYKQMRDAGMDEKQAYEMTQKFMANFSMGSMISDMLGGAIKKGMKDDDDDEDKD
jgi:hypothetical protein